MYHYHVDCPFYNLVEYPRMHIFYPCSHCGWNEKREDVSGWHARNTEPLDEGRRARQPVVQGTIVLPNVILPSESARSSQEWSLQNIQALQRSVQEQSVLLREQERLLRQRRLRFDDNDSDLPEGSRSRDSDASSIQNADYELPQFPTDFETAGYLH